MNKQLIGLAAVATLVIGGGYIVYSGRPVIQMDRQEAASGDSSASGPKSYSMADVQAHATADSCWATINGSVYDLTTWVSRHPGGPDKIISLCGTDGSERFNKKHGNFLKAQDALVLLKIGILK